MKIISKDLKHQKIKLVAENLDDIWHLYNIIDIEDLVRAVTFRTAEDGKDDMIRSKKSEKKRMKLGIRVKEIKFHEFSDRLRIQGIIEEGPQDLGSHHTFNITSDDLSPVSIIKKEWKHHHLKRIDEAVKQSTQALVTFVALDEDTATIAILRQSGVQWITDIDSKRSGKMFESTDTEKQYLGEIISVLKNNVQDKSSIVIIGPGFGKEHLYSYLKQNNQELIQKTQVHATAHSGMTGIQEALKIGIVDKITKDNRVSYETQIIERVFEEIKKNGLVTYGYEEVKNAALNGAVEKLIITDTVVRTKKGENLLDIAKQNNSDFTIINTLHEAGKKIEGIGGIAAILRYKI